MAHFLLLWRPLWWWREQQFYEGMSLNEENNPKHPVDWGYPRRFEDSLALNWAVEALDKYSESN